MKKEYDFSNAEQGKFYIKPEEINFPIYLEKDIRAFFTELSAKKHSEINNLVNRVLRKEVEMLHEVGIS